MWKTRFEVNTSHSNDWTRHHNRSSSSSIIHQYYSRPSPTVPRVREDSPSAIVRPSPPSSIPNLAIVTEEDEDIPCSNLINNEQPNLILRKQTSYQTMNKHQIVLPTIIESNDHEVMIDHEQNKYEESIDNKHKKYVKRQDSFVATNTNYNQVMNVNIDRKERIINTNKNNQISESTLDKRIKELLQQKKQRQNKSTSSSSDVNNAEILIPTTFKDISAFFENKALAVFTSNISEQKKMVRAKRSLSLNRSMPINNKDLTKLEIISSTEKESTIFHHQIKRIKTTHKSIFDCTNEPEIIVKDSIAEHHSIRTIVSKQSPMVMNNMSSKTTLPKRWFILLLFPITMLLYFYLSNLPNIYKFDSFIYLPKSPSNSVPQQSKESIHLINNNVIARYGQFVRNYFFSSLDLLMTFIGQLFFRIDKYQYKNNIAYVATSTYELIYDWFIHLFK